jgi:hypothetical protein
VEWLAAIRIHQETGYGCLLSYIEPKGSPQVLKMQQVLPENVSSVVLNWGQYGSLPPDLLFYKPDLTDWFFCEVKAPGISARGGIIAVTRWSRRKRVRIRLDKPVVEMEACDGSDGQAVEDE